MESSFRLSCSAAPDNNRTFPRPLCCAHLEKRGGEVTNYAKRILTDLYFEWLAAGKPERGQGDTKKEPRNCSEQSRGKA